MTLAPTPTRHDADHVGLAHEQVAAHLAAGDALVVDLRDPDEVAAGGELDGALHAPGDLLVAWTDPCSNDYREVFHPRQRIVLVCADGTRSAEAAAMLRRFGYEDVVFLAGGFGAGRAG